ncbi:MAG: DUF6261 family protein [Tannerellaceae bacterium]|jgi:hypothetical protein|nr:DUF6261 family protein [Tannerellaceae bacterium]
MLEIIIQPSVMGKLRNAEHFDMLFNVVLHVKSKGELKPAALLTSWNAFDQAFDHEDKIYKRAAKREETTLIKAAHEKRKKSYMGFKYLVEAASYDGTPASQDAAKLILSVMENYHSAYYAPMTEASALFVNLVQDMEKENHADKVALITGAAVALANLKANNEAFITLMAGRTFAEEEAKVEGTMSDARKQTDQKFTLFAEDVNAFYRTNERAATKDPEVSALLADIIVFINSYIHKYETTYSRRNAKYHSGGNKPSQPDEELPDEPAQPAIPEFSINAQETLGNSSVISGYGTQMTLRATDPEAFADVLYPVARGGILKLAYPETENAELYPIADFLFDTDGTTPIGLLVDAPNAYTAFAKPFVASGPAETQVLKDDQLLAILLEVQFPATMSEG